MLPSGGAGRVWAGRGGAREGRLLRGMGGQPAWQAAPAGVCACLRRGAAGSAAACRSPGGPAWRARPYRTAEKSHLYYGDVEVVVLDEADTMFDRGFGPEVKAILAAVRGKEQPARCVLVSATMSKAVGRLIGAWRGAARRAAFGGRLLTCCWVSGCWRVWCWLAAGQPPAVPRQRARACVLGSHSVTRGPPAAQRQACALPRAVAACLPTLPALPCPACLSLPRPALRR